MKTCSMGMRLELGDRRSLAPPFILASRPALTHWINEAELAEWQARLAQGNLPVDFLWKLKRLAGGDLSHQFIEQHCRLFAALLLASEAGDFRDISPTGRERLSRVLAYVRQEVDAIPDYLPGGFTDDQQEVRAVLEEMGGLLSAFKAWRLRHQVPRLWRETRARKQD